MSAAMEVRKDFLKWATPMKAKGTLAWPEWQRGGAALLIWGTIWLLIDGEFAKDEMLRALFAPLCRGVIALSARFSPHRYAQAC